LREDLGGQLLECEFSPIRGPVFYCWNLFWNEEATVCSQALENDILERKLQGGQ